MKRDDYKRVIDHIKVDDDLEKRLEQKVIMKNRKTIPLYHKVLAVGAAALLMVGLILILPKLQGERTHIANPSPDAEVTPVTQSLFSGFNVVAYAAGSEGATLTGNYPEETTATVMAPKVEIMLPTYSPLMSSVPGLPFDIRFETPQGEEIAPDRIEVTIDQGSLCTWNQVTFKVEEKGEAVTLKESMTLYWSPLYMDKAVNEITMTIQSMHGDTTVDTQVIVIKKLDEMRNYAAVGAE